MGLFHRSMLYAAPAFPRSCFAFPAANSDGLGLGDVPAECLKRASFPAIGGKHIQSPKRFQTAAHRRRSPRWHVPSEVRRVLHDPESRQHKLLFGRRPVTISSDQGLRGQNRAWEAETHVMFDQSGTRFIACSRSHNSYLYRAWHQPPRPASS